MASRPTPRMMHQGAPRRMMPPRPGRPTMFAPGRGRPRLPQPQSASAASFEQPQAQQQPAGGPPSLAVLLGPQLSNLPSERQNVRLELLEAIASKISGSRLDQILSRYDSDRIGVGGSTGDSDVGEQSQGPNLDENPCESAAQIEQTIFEETGSNVAGGQYAALARKVIEHIRKSDDLSISSEKDAKDLVSMFSSQRPQNPPTAPSAASSNPFGGPMMRRPPSRPPSMAQGGAGRQRARPRFAAVGQFAPVMPTPPKPELEQPQASEQPQSSPPAQVPPTEQQPPIDTQESSQAPRDPPPSFPPPPQNDDKSDSEKDDANPIGLVSSLFGGPQQPQPNPQPESSYILAADQPAQDPVDERQDDFGANPFHQSSQDQQSAPEEAGNLERKESNDDDDQPDYFQQQNLTQTRPVEQQLQSDTIPQASQVFTDTNTQQLASSANVFFSDEQEEQSSFQFSQLQSQEQVTMSQEQYDERQSPIVESGNANVLFGDSGPSQSIQQTNSTPQKVNNSVAQNDEDEDEDGDVFNSYFSKPQSQQRSPVQQHRQQQPQHSEPEQPQMMASNVFADQCTDADTNQAQSAAAIFSDDRQASSNAFDSHLGQGFESQQRFVQDQQTESQAMATSLFYSHEEQPEERNMEQNQNPFFNEQSHEVGNQESDGQDDDHQDATMNNAQSLFGGGSGGGQAMGQRQQQQQNNGGDLRGLDVVNMRSNESMAGVPRLESMDVNFAQNNQGASSLFADDANVDYFRNQPSDQIFGQRVENHVQGDPLANRISEEAEIPLSATSQAQQQTSSAVEAYREPHNINSHQSQASTSNQHASFQHQDSQDLNLQEQASGYQNSTENNVFATSVSPVVTAPPNVRSQGSSSRVINISSEADGDAQVYRGFQMGDVQPNSTVAHVFAADDASNQQMYGNGEDTAALSDYFAPSRSVPSRGAAASSSALQNQAQSSRVPESAQSQERGIPTVSNPEPPAHVTQESTQLYASSMFGDEDSNIEHVGQSQGFPTTEKQTAAVLFAMQSNQNPASVQINQNSQIFKSEAADNKTQLGAALFDDFSNQQQHLHQYNVQTASNSAQQPQGSEALVSEEPARPTEPAQSQPPPISQQFQAKSPPQSQSNTQLQTQNQTVPNVYHRDLQPALLDQLALNQASLQTEPIQVPPQQRERINTAVNVVEQQSIHSARHQNTNSMSLAAGLFGAVSGGPDADGGQQPIEPVFSQQEQAPSQQSKEQIMSQSMMMVTSPTERQSSNKRDSLHQIDTGANQAAGPMMRPSQSARKEQHSDRPPVGFIQPIASSKPPQSVASVNFSTMMEDSESIIRAYKKKKAELETLRDQFYQVETQLFTESRQRVIMEEENSALKGRVAELERLLKDSQMREIRRESADALSTQLAIKNKEVEMYQKEVQHQKAINVKLQEKMKDLVMRKSTYSAQSAAQSAAQRDKMQSSQPEIAHSDFQML